MSMNYEHKPRGSQEDIVISISDRMEKILDSIPETGSDLREAHSLVEDLRDDLFSAEYILQLKDRGIEVEKVFSNMSGKKVEITLSINHPEGERLVTVRYKRGEGGSIRITNGTREGEKVLKEESLPESLDKGRAKIIQVVEELVSGK